MSIAILSQDAFLAWCSKIGLHVNKKERANWIVAVIRNDGVLMSHVDFNQRYDAEIHVRNYYAYKTAITPDQFVERCTSVVC